jgi:hypothetical protein
MNAVVSAMVLALAQGSLGTSLDINPSPKHSSVILKGVEGSPGGHHKTQGRSKSDSPPKSGCTYSGMYIVCPTPGPAPSGAVFTPGLAQSAVENLPMPALELNVQPDGPTLVNAPTLFYTEPEPFSTSIDLLGHTIEVRAEPVSFIWVHGDGTSQSTSTPGKPYPNRDVAHRYMKPEDVSARVDTVYEVEFSIDGDGWESLDAPLIAAGPSTSVEVQEAAPVLVR